MVDVNEGIRLENKDSVCFCYGLGVFLGPGTPLYIVQLIGEKFRAQSMS